MYPDDAKTYLRLALDLEKRHAVAHDQRSRKTEQVDRIAREMRAAHRDHIAFVVAAHHRDLDAHRVFVDGFCVDDEDVVSTVGHRLHGLKPLQNKGFSNNASPEAL